MSATVHAAGTQLRQFAVIVWNMSYLHKEYPLANREVSTYQAALL